MRYFAGYRAHALILGMLTLLTYSIQTPLRSRYALERRKIEIEAWQLRTREIANTWNALNYTDVNDQSCTEAFLRKIGSPRLKLSERQRARLEPRLRDLFKYLAAPSLEEYYRLKTEGLTWRFKPSERAASLLGETNSMFRRNMIDEPRETVDLLWQTLIKQNNGGAVNRLRAVCLDQIGVEKSQEGAARAILKGKISKGFTLAYEAPDPGFEYLSSRKIAADDSSEQFFVHLSFFARSETSNEGQPRCHKVLAVLFAFKLPAKLKERMGPKLESNYLPISVSLF